MFCKYCGKQIADGAKFCAYCGKETGMGGNTAQNQPVQKEGNHSFEGKVPFHGSANTPARRQSSKPVRNAGFHWNIGSMGWLLSFLLFVISLFIPNTAESKAYEALNQAAGFLGFNVPEMTIVKPIVGNLGAQLQDGRIEIMTLFYLAVIPFIVIWAIALAVIVVTRIRDGKGAVSSSSIWYSVYLIYLAAVIVYICHGDRMEMRGAGYWVLAASAVLTFVFSCVEYLIMKKEAQQR